MRMSTLLLCLTPLLYYGQQELGILTQYENLDNQDVLSEAIYESVLIIDSLENLNGVCNLPVYLDLPRPIRDRFKKGVDSINLKREIIFISPDDSIFKRRPCWQLIYFRANGAFGSVELEFRRYTPEEHSSEGHFQLWLKARFQGGIINRIQYGIYPVDSALVFPCPRVGLHAYPGLEHTREFSSDTLVNFFAQTNKYEIENKEGERYIQLIRAVANEVYNLSKSEDYRGFPLYDTLYIQDYSGLNPISYHETIESGLVLQFIDGWHLPEYSSRSDRLPSYLQIMNYEENYREETLLQVRYWVVSNRHISLGYEAIYVLAAMSQQGQIKVVNSSIIGSHLSPFYFYTLPGFWEIHKQ